MIGFAPLLMPPMGLIFDLQGWFMITLRDIRKTRKLIEKKTNVLLQNTPGLLKQWGKEKAQDVVTNYLLMEGFKAVYQYEPDNDKHHYGKPCRRCKNTLRYRSDDRCVTCKKTRNAITNPHFNALRPTKRNKSQDIQSYPQDTNTLTS